MNKLGAAIIMFSFGIPYFLEGEEGGRTKLGIENGYNIPKNITQIDYERIYKFVDLLEYYKKIIKLKILLYFIKNELLYFTKFTKRNYWFSFK